MKKCYRNNIPCAFLILDKCEINHYPSNKKYATCGLYRAREITRIEQITLDGSEYNPITSDDWETPPELFDPLNERYKFTLDPCCTDKTAKCELYYTPKENGLKQAWSGRVFVNPPFSKIPEWLEKISFEMSKTNHPELIVALLPAWTDRNWFHDFIDGKTRIEFLRGRVKFLLNGKKRKSPKFGCMLVEWR